jgi:hypothetical protein
MLPVRAPRPRNSSLSPGGQGVPIVSSPCWADPCAMSPGQIGNISSWVEDDNLTDVEPRSDVVHVRAGLTQLALDHIGDRGLLEHTAGSGGGVGEDAL